VLGKAAPPSSRSARIRGKRSPKSSGFPVHLFLFVKVRENWGDDPVVTGKWDWISPRKIRNKKK